MIKTLKGGKYEKGNLTKTVGMKKVTFPKQGSETETKLKGFSASGTSQPLSACLRRIYLVFKTLVHSLLH